MAMQYTCVLILMTLVSQSAAITLKRMDRSTPRQDFDEYLKTIDFEDPGYYSWPLDAGRRECQPLQGALTFPYSAKMTNSRDLKGITYITVGGERDGKMQSMLARRASGTPYKAFNAVTVDSLHDHVLTDWSTGRLQLYPGQNYNDYTQNAVKAIYLSHAMAMENIRANHNVQISPDDMYLILEDDVSLAEDWNTMMNKHVEMLPDDWDILKVGFWGDRACEGVKVNDLVWQAAGPSSDRHYMGNHGYLVRAGSIAKILEHLKQTDLQDIDRVLLTSGTGANDIKVYAARYPFDMVHLPYARSIRMP